MADVDEPDAAATVKSSPVPASATDCVPFAALLLLSMTFSVAFRAPPAEGVKATLIVQFLPAASAAVVLHVELDWTAKSFASAPETTIELTVRGSFPLLVRVTVETGALEPTSCELNVTVAGPSDASGAVPVPVRFTDCVLFASALLLSVIVNVAVRVPMPEGAKATLMAQFAPAATELPQVLVSVNSPALAPPMLMLVTESIAEPVLLSVIV